MSCETCGGRGRIRVSKGDSEDCPDCNSGVVTKLKLADRAKETTAKARYAGHRSKEEQYRTAHQLEIDAAEAILEETVLADADQRKDCARLMTVRESCTLKTLKHGGYVLTCDQCLAFKERLEAEGFQVSVSESKHQLHLDISWKETE
jgi:hypothetical protein